MNSFCTVLIAASRLWYFPLLAAPKDLRGVRNQDVLGCFEESLFQQLLNFHQIQNGVKHNGIVRVNVTSTDQIDRANHKQTPVTNSQHESSQSRMATTMLPRIESKWVTNHYLPRRLLFV